MRKPGTRTPRDGAEASTGTVVIIIGLVALAAVAAAAVVTTQDIGGLIARDSGLRVTEVELWRQNLTDKGWWDITMNATLMEGSEPLDVSSFMIHMSNSTARTDYNHSRATTFPHGEGGRSFFVATWIRGDGANATMQPGDIVSFHLNMNNMNVYRLSAGTQQKLAILVPGAASVSGDFVTPELGQEQSTRAR